MSKEYFGKKLYLIKRTATSTFRSTASAASRDSENPIFRYTSDIFTLLYKYEMSWKMLPLALPGKRPLFCRSSIKATNKLPQTGAFMRMYSASDLANVLRSGKMTLI